MIRITRLADYGIVLLTHMARRPLGVVHSVSDLAREARLPLPTVSKILKLLAREGLLVSHRGVRGGYSLPRGPETITVAEIITIMDGPISITECSGRPSDPCEYLNLCPVRGNLQRINGAILSALEKITLAEMGQPLPQELPFLEYRRPAAAAIARPAGDVERAEPLGALAPLPEGAAS